ncbi:Glycogen-binding subunit 76A [Orchesella cincta]|uniref:Glycogen-binding subunit 76A n=1 Tax=Orchesella cincta TaxID=48709 RepID=A0A1D2MJ38_ORCCI|nr:Glycogen-binding subunit 76A [Orchesella cincta]
MDELMRMIKNFVGLATRVSNLEISLLSPVSPPSTEPCSNTALFAQRLQMKLKSHLEASDSSSSSEEYFTNSTASHEEDTTSSNSEIFYDFDDVVYDEELTSDYGTGGSNSTVVASRSSSSGSSSSGSSVLAEESKLLTKPSEISKESEDCGGSGVTYRRSSSLKSGKTPPGTPMKKIVRFADAMGLDLTDIKVFLDEIPKVPKEAYRDLHIPDYQGPPSSGSTNNNDTSSMNFYNTLVSRSNLNFVRCSTTVLLENAYLTQETISNTQTRSSQVKQVIKGSVRVMNLDFHKSVYVRYTYNDWKDFQDFLVTNNLATYMPGSCDGFSDNFRVQYRDRRVSFPAPYLPGHDDAKLQFACRFHCQGNQFWDNNQGRNYVFQNVPTVSKSGMSPGFYDQPV